jgi:hypothetical protein
MPPPYVAFLPVGRQKLPSGAAGGKRCFDKLGVGARQELADALARPAP